MKVLTYSGLQKFLSKLNNKFASKTELSNYTPSKVEQIFIGYENKQKYKLTYYDNLISGGAVGSSTSVYWPWVIYVGDKLASPLGQYYMFYSTDHAGTTGGIYLAYSNDLTTGWTVYGQVYRNLKSGSTYYETETPSVIWDSKLSQFVMYFQSAGSYVGESQTSWYVTSSDGITWSNLTKMFDIDGERIQGNLHNGYALPFNFHNSYFCYSLMGGGNGGAALSWSEDGGYTWITDHRRLGRWGIEANGSKFMYPNHGTPIFLDGQMYWLGMWSNFSFGTTTKISRIALMPMSDLRTLIGTEDILFEPSGSYQGDNLRTLSVYTDNGKLYIYYNCAIGSASYINLLVCEADKTNAIISTLRITTQPISTKTLYANRFSDEALSVSASITTDSIINYQWYSNTTNNVSSGIAIEGANTSTFTIPTTLSEGTYYYYCIVSSTDTSSITSNISCITVINPAIVITTQPINKNFSEGNISDSISVSATVNDASTLSYQWYSNTANSNSGGTILTGETNNTFTIPTSLTVGTYYYYCVINSTTSLTVSSSVSTITIAATLEPLLSITTQPENVTAQNTAIDNNLTIVAALTNSTSTITYQWYKNTTQSTTDAELLTNATTATYSLPQDLAAGTYYYYCIVSADGATSIQSNYATVTITQINYLAYYNVTGTANNTAPSYIADTSGNNNAQLNIYNISNYAENGQLEFTGNASATSSTGKYVSLSGLVLPVSYKFHLKFDTRNSTTKIGVGFSHRLITSETIDYESMLGGYTNASYDGYKIESSVLSDIDKTFPAGNFPTGFLRSSIVSLTIDINVTNDTLAYTLTALNTSNATTTVTGSQSTPGFTNSISTHLTIGNIEYGTNAYSRAPNATLAEFWIEEV